MANKPIFGIYAGIPYNVVTKDEKLYIAISPEAMNHLGGLGANLHLLDDIGEQDPDEVMEKLFDSIPKKEDQK